MRWVLGWTWEVAGFVSSTAFPHCHGTEELFRTAPASSHMQQTRRGAGPTLQMAALREGRVSSSVLMPLRLALPSVAGSRGHPCHHRADKGDVVSPLGLMPTSWASLLVPLPRVSSIVLPGPDAGPALLTAAVGEGSANSPSLMTSGPVLPASGIGKGKRSSLPFPPHHMVDEGVLDHLRP